MATVEQALPALRDGEKMTRDEFLRRWEMHPEIKRAELIGGTVYMPSPVSVQHGLTEEDLGGWLFHYRVNSPGTDSGCNTTTLMLDDSPQPDRFLILLPECGGQAFVSGKYLSGAPELMAEVCLSSKHYDLNAKYDLYQAAGVQEYLAVLAEDREIRWRQLISGHNQILAPDDDGIWRSRGFPGLWLEGEALLRRDTEQLITMLQEGLASREHQAFVARLAELRSGR
jgi:hypothetical protein